jgi:hypothetical protein
LFFVSEIIPFIQIIFYHFLEAFEPGSNVKAFLIPVKAFFYVFDGIANSMDEILNG